MKIVNHLDECFHTIVIGDITGMRLYGNSFDRRWLMKFANKYLADSLEPWTVEPIRSCKHLPWGDLGLPELPWDALGLVKPEELS